MRDLTCILILSLALIATGCGIIPLTEEYGQEIALVQMETELGNILIVVDSARAPVTAKNFLRYVAEGAYDGGRFHRVVHMDNQPNDDIKIEVIQGGKNREKEGHSAIPLERTNKTGLKHVDGAISMARGGPDTATSDFFICINDQPSLDFGGMRNADGQGFAAFGMVIEGMDVVQGIQKSATNERRAQSLDPPISIIKVTRLK